MPQFFISPENIINNNIFIKKKSDINHIINVLRGSIGDKLTLIANEEVIYEVEIFSIEPDLIQTKIVEMNKACRKLNINITLAQSILKSQKQDIVIQKATELGANAIIPFISRNTVVKFHSEKDKEQKVQRWQKIAYESSKQCKRVSIPDISHIIYLGELIDLNDFDVILVCAEKEPSYTIKEFLKQNKSANIKQSNILVIIGPEGGWDEKEIKVFKEKNFALVGLGNLILRAETAAITAISDIIYEYEL